MKYIASLVVLSLSLLAGPADAQQSAAGQACRADIQKLCPGISAGGGKIRECLAAHAAELSDGCQAAVKPQGGAAAAAGITACDADTKSFCKGVQPGSGRVIDCLIDHQKDLSDACYGVLIKRQDAMDATSAKTAK